MKRQATRIAIPLLTLLPLTVGSLLDGARASARQATASGGTVLALAVYAGDGPAVPGDILALRGDGSAAPLVKSVVVRDMAVSPRGDLIALAEGERGLWEVRTDGSAVHRLLPAPRSRNGNTLGVVAVAWSPDGYTIAYSINAVQTGEMGGPAPVVRPDTATGVYFTTADGKAPVSLATNRALGALDAKGAPLTIDRLSWAADGRSLAVSTTRAADGRSRAAILSVDAESGTVRLLVGGGRDATYSSTGTLAYLTGKGYAPPGTDPHSALHLLDPRGRQGVILRTRDTIADPVWSPNGAQIAYRRISYVATGDAAPLNGIRSVAIATGMVRTLAGQPAQPYGMWGALAWSKR